MTYQFNEVSTAAKEVLGALSLYTIERCLLVLGTIATESDFCAFLKQKGGGPGMGPGQIEPATHKDCNRYINSKPKLIEKIKKLNPEYINAPIELVLTDLKYAILLIVIKYYMSPIAINSADPEDLAEQWKTVYNTTQGKGKLSDFIAKFNKYVQPYLRERLHETF